MKDVKSAAKREKLSVSRWARKYLTRAAAQSWPDGYFSLFGALKDSDLERPPQGASADDIPRKRL
jgi:hypothetical protein